MPLLLFLVFVVVPVAELVTIILVGELIGFWWTLALLLAGVVLGSTLLRAQGRLAWRRFKAAIAEGRTPTREVLDGVLVIFGGTLLIVPGFLTDVLGALLLFPPTRALLRRVLLAHTALRLIGAFPGGPRRGGGTPYDVDGTAVDVEPRHLDRPR